MGLAAASRLGVQSMMIYMLVYLVMNLGAFLAIIAIAQATGSETVADCNGLARSPRACRLSRRERRGRLLPWVRDPSAVRARIAS
jgi:NADH:ubiquinone oxidoreductase subunit 2 (subunit N)